MFAVGCETGPAAFGEEAIVALRPGGVGIVSIQPFCSWKGSGVRCDVKLAMTIDWKVVLGHAGRRVGCGIQEHKVRSHSAMAAVPMIWFVGGKPVPSIGDCHNGS